MIGGLDGTPVWTVLMTTSEIDENSASATFSARVLAVAKSERAAKDIAYELVPHTPRDAYLSIEETVMIDS